MNQSKIWRVVKPGVGLPLFLGAVAVTALLVHGALLLKTDWFGGYWNGGKKVHAAEIAPATPVATAPQSQ